MVGKIGRLGIHARNGKTWEEREETNMPILN